jgi:hypothetical protein
LVVKANSPKDRAPVDIRHDLDIDSEVRGDGKASDRLRRMAEAFI